MRRDLGSRPRICAAFIEIVAGVQQALDMRAVSSVQISTLKKPRVSA
jgi:hypothetical protein